MDVLRASSQKKSLRSEMQLLQKIYNKVTAEVAKYAKEHEIKIVRRIIRTVPHKKEIEENNPKKILESDPKEILRRMNQEVVYIESIELDITEDILERLQPKTKVSSSKNERN
jgi:hypothetical protein